MHSGDRNPLGRLTAQGRSNEMQNATTLENFSHNNPHHRFLRDANHTNLICLKSQQGAAVVLALVTVLLTATITASVISGLGRAIDSATGLHDQGQARQLARAAVDWARNVLADDFMRTAIDHMHEPWAIKIPPTPLGAEAEVGGEIQDWSGRLNLNNLALDGKPDLIAAEQFSRLLTALAIPPGQAQRATESLLRRISTTNMEGLGDVSQTDSDLHGQLLDLGELRAIDGFDDDLMRRLSPFAVTVPGRTKININTAPAEVIFAITSGIDLSYARILVAERDRNWYRNVADLTARLPTGASLTDTSHLDVKSRYFLVSGRARYGVSVVTLEALLDRRSTWPEIVWQRIP